MSCLKPIAIKNPFYNGRYLSPLTRSLYDCESQFIYVPCGQCPACLEIKQQYIVQRLEIEQNRSDTYFITLTYDDSHLPFFTFPDGYVMPYPDKRDIQLMFKRIRKDKVFTSFKYYCVSEYGHVTHRPHWHLLLFLPKSDNTTVALYNQFYIQSVFQKYWSINVSTQRKPRYEPLSSIIDCQYTVGSSALYVSKYVLKLDDWCESYKTKLKLTFDEDTFKTCWNIVRPCSLSSKHLGYLSKDEIKSIIKPYLANNTVSPSIPSINRPGYQYPLCPYYRKNLSLDDFLQFRSNNKQFNLYESNLLKNADYSGIRHSYLFNRRKKMKNQKL